MISTFNLHFSYDRKRKLFEGIDLTIEAGKIYGLLGKNGTGKSTLLKLISGVLFPTFGSIRLNEYNPVDRSLICLRIFSSFLRITNYLM